MKIVDEQHVALPQDSALLDMQWQGATETLALWVLVNPDKSPVPRRLCLVYTRQDFTVTGSYVATAQVGGMVWHLFDGGEIPTR